MSNNIITGTVAIASPVPCWNFVTKIVADSARNQYWIDEDSDGNKFNFTEIFIDLDMKYSEYLTGLDVILSSEEPIYTAIDAIFSEGFGNPINIQIQINMLLKSVHYTTASPLIYNWWHSSGINMDGNDMTRINHIGLFTEDTYFPADTIITIYGR